MIKEFCEYIETLTAFEVGTNLFAGYVASDTPDDCIWVNEVSPGMTEYQLTDRVDKPFQLISRAGDYFTARDNAQTVFDALHGKMQVNLPVVTSGEIYCVNIVATSPFYIGQDETNRRHLFSVNFLLTSQEV